MSPRKYGPTCWLSTKSRRLTCFHNGKSVNRRCLLRWWFSCKVINSSRTGRSQIRSQIHSQIRSHRLCTQAHSSRWGSSRFCRHTRDYRKLAGSSWTHSSWTHSSWTHSSWAGSRGCYSSKAGSSCSHSKDGSRWSCSRWSGSKAGSSRTHHSWTHSRWAGSKGSSTFCQVCRVGSCSEVSFCDSDESFCFWAFILWTPNVGTNKQDFPCCFFLLVITLDLSRRSCSLSVLRFMKIAF